MSSTRSLKHGYVALGVLGMGATAVWLSRRNRKKANVERGGSCAAMSVGWIGLGAMGFPMAGHVSRKVLAAGGSFKVWNRTKSKARDHSSRFGTAYAVNLQDLSGCDVVFSMLPTTKEVQEASAKVRDVRVWIDCTSGDPGDTVTLGNALAAKGTKLVDCPVSGGPRGATAGTVTAMMGGDQRAVDEVLPLVGAFASKMERCGPLGSGMAVKAVNNALNSLHLAAAAEGLLALKAAGVSPSRALEVINASSGRSLQTQVRIPEEVITRRFAYGFKLQLMQKDCDCAAQFLKQHFPCAQIIHSAVQVVRDAAESQGGDADYTDIVRFLEKRAGVELDS